MQILIVPFLQVQHIFTKLNSKSKEARLVAESQIRESNLDWTIIRPTMILVVEMIVI